MLNWIINLIFAQKPFSDYNFLMAHSLIGIVFAWMIDTAFFGIFFLYEKKKLIPNNYNNKIFSSQKFIYAISLSYLIFSSIIAINISVIFNFNIYPSLAEYNNFPYLEFFKQLYVFSPCICLVISTVLIILLHKNSIDLSLKMPSLKSLIYIIPIFIALIITILTFYAYTINAEINETIFWYTNANEIIIILNIIKSIVIIPIFEELFFRAISFQYFKENFGIIFGIIISSLFFMINHLGGSYLQLIFVFVAGVVLTLMFQLTKSIYVPIIFHSMVNTIYVLIIIIEANEMITIV